MSVKRKEWLLFVLSGSALLLISLLLLRWLAPQLLGIPVELQLVKVSKEMPPFYEGVFRKVDYESDEYLISDPYTQVRAYPMFPDLGSVGPNDVLGFRNRAIPVVADILVIGDSQTYGNNASLQDNWPERMRFNLRHKSPRVYSMATSGWGAVQYLDMAYRAPLFLPKILIVAFYTGNDPMDSFITAYGIERWGELRPDGELTKADAPEQGTLLGDAEAEWLVQFSDEVETVFNPRLRSLSNQQHPAIDAGYAIMLKVAELIAGFTDELDIKAVFTIIPTKEFVYQDKIRSENFVPTPEYEELIKHEATRIESLSKGIRQLENSLYVDVVTPLRKAALQDRELYPKNVNGHPVANGYRVIADAVAHELDKLLPAKPQDGLVAVDFTENDSRFGLLRNGNARLFKSRSLVEANGWDPEKPVARMSARDFATYNVLPSIVEIAIPAYGPASHP